MELLSGSGGGSTPDGKVESKRPPLRLLAIEDSEEDAYLLVHEVRRAYDVTFERVDSAAAMLRALERGPWDIIISDNSMPSFTAMEAFRLVRAVDPCQAFLIMSGVLDPRTAAEATREGVAGYLLKDQKGELLPAIARAVAAAANCRSQRQRSGESGEARDSLRGETHAGRTALPGNRT